MQKVSENDHEMLQPHYTNQSLHREEETHISNTHIKASRQLQ